MPVSPAMRELEGELSGFDLQAFVDVFEEAGGIWVGLSQETYLSYDGSHLDRDVAIRFSRDVARRIVTLRGNSYETARNSATK